jgi:Elongation factor SelB, winged helix.
VVLDPFPGRRPVAVSRRVFSGIAAASSPARFKSILGSAGMVGVAADLLPVRLGVSAREAGSIIAGEGCVISEGRCFSRSAVDAAMAGILAALIRAETTFPLERGVQLNTASESPHWDHRLGRAALAELVGSGSVEVDGSLVRRAGWAPLLSPAHEAMISSLVHAICSGNSEPPSAGELVEKYGGEVPGLLRYLEREGRVVQVAADRYYAPEVVDLLIGKLRENLQPGAEYGPSQLRDTLGFSRKYLIPFLEYCDRTGVTERKGDGRTLGSGANP